MSTNNSTLTTRNLFMTSKPASLLTTIAIMVIAILVIPLTSRSADTLRLATTTSTYETGLLEVILPPFEKKHNVTVHCISVGTGKALKLGENGDVDLILVHARAAEDKFIENGYGVNRRDVMYNDFVILGPKKDPAGIKGTTNATAALGRMAEGQQTFVSRGDDSGTHKKEQSFWSKLGLTPKGSWYLEAGQGMSATLRMADEKNAYVLVDRATYAFNQKSLRLDVMVQGDKDLLNYYGVIAIDPKKHKHAKYELAMSLIAWLTSPQCQKMIGEFAPTGLKLFTPDTTGPAQ
jgi:tungstate transport system substrate-binding protein